MPKEIPCHPLQERLTFFSELEEISPRCSLRAPNVIIPGIPFPTLRQSAGSKVPTMISTVLPNQGRFVAYQVSDRIMTLCHSFLSKGGIMEFEFFNIPPGRVFRWVHQVI